MQFYLLAFSSGNTVIMQINKMHIIQNIYGSVSSSFQFLFQRYKKKKELMHIQLISSVSAVMKAFCSFEMSQSSEI